MFENRSFDAAVPLFKTFLERNQKNGHAWMLLGESALEINDTATAVNAFNVALQIDSVRYARAWAILGQLYLERGSYEQANAVFAKAIASSVFRDDERLMLAKAKEINELRYNLSLNPHSVTIKNPGPPINTTADEVPNSILLDGSMLLITRKEAGEGREGRPASESFFVIHRMENDWSSPQDFVPWKSRDYNMGAPALSPDGNVLWFTGCGWPGGMGSCDLYFSKFENGHWSRPVNAGSTINSPAWDSQPAISADGLTLIFASNRPGGFGGSDLYRAIRLPDGQWSRPVNLGPLINTSGNEMSPFFHPDGKTLYFSSDGLPGMGGFDLFMSRLDAAERFTKPQNLGVPINSSEDELNIIVDAGGQVAWMAARRKSGFGGYDIYNFNLPHTLKPKPLRTLKILVADAETNKPVKALVRVNSLVDDNVLYEGYCRETDGQTLLALPVDEKFAVFAGSEGYLYFSENFDFSANDVSSQLTIEIKLMPAITGNNLVINNINFEFNSAELLHNSYPALHHLLAFLMQNPSVHIEISGHTDNIGSSSFNQRLSLQRAEAVLKWLTDNGVDKMRIMAKGYGASQPISTNDNEQGRALNRRTEIKILRDR